MSAELVLAIKQANEVRKLCAAFKKAGPELEERSLKVESGWFRCIRQLEFLKIAHGLLDEDHRELQERTLRMFIFKLDGASQKLRELTKSQLSWNGKSSEVITAPRPLLYALKKDSLDEVIDALETWQSMSDPSWYLILRLCDSRLTERLASETQLKESIPSASMIHQLPQVQDELDLRLSATALQNMHVVDIALSSSKVVRTLDADGSIQQFVLDCFDAADARLLSERTAAISNLAQRLQHDDPATFNLLQCKGFIAQESEIKGDHFAELAMMFKTPSGLLNPQSLREWLLYGDSPSSLSHKNVRQETILCFRKLDSEEPSIFLVGFGEFRLSTGTSQRNGDDNVEKNLYRHWTRQGALPEQYYTMQYDIYSLGVCLLETGLWKIFIDYDSEGLGCRLTWLFHLEAGTPKRRVSRYLLESSRMRLPELTRNDLRKQMGTQYAEIVETCLTCLESNNANFGDPREFCNDPNGIHLGVRYIEKVLHRLNSLNI